MQPTEPPDLPVDASVEDVVLAIKRLQAEWATHTTDLQPLIRGSIWHVEEARKKVLEEMTRQLAPQRVKPNRAMRRAAAKKQRSKKR